MTTTVAICNCHSFNHFQNFFTFVFCSELNFYCWLSMYLIQNMKERKNQTK